jgi:tRNA-splicing ligase RtcB
MTKITVRGDVDPRAVKQLERCAEAGDSPIAAICADGHVGYSQPIGGVIAYQDKISPSGVGYDIGCGNKAVQTNIKLEDLRYDGLLHCAMMNIMDEIAARISFGMGRVNDEAVDHPVLDEIGEAAFIPQRAMREMAANQLGTIGSGNHYVDLFVDEDGWVWVGVHFGSRGFGHKTANGFLAMAQGKRFTDKGHEGEDSPPVLFDTDSDLGQSYIEAMQLAGRYAYAGRDVVVEKVLSILGAEATHEVHNHHNFAWLETQPDVGKVWVVRKGCTPAFPGQQGFVGATMGEDSVILEGVRGEQSRDLLRSTVHGAGRVMSRTQAAGKTRWRLSCSNRDCDWVAPKGTQRPDECPTCGNTRLKKRPVNEGGGAIDWPATRAELDAKGIELRGGAADEAPGAYKRLDDVLAAHADSIEVLHRLTPIGVCMAGADTFDPFKD